MWRDRWLALGVVGALLTCVACLSPLAVIALGAIGLGAWTGRLDVALLLLLLSFVTLAAYRYRACRRRTPGGWARRGEPGRMDRRCPLVALLPLATRGHRARPGKRGVHGRHNAVPMGADPGRDSRHRCLYTRDRRRCARLACRMAGSRLTLSLLILATLVVGAAIALDRLPELTSDLIAWASGDASTGEHAAHGHKGMGDEAQSACWLTIALSLFAASSATVDTSIAVLTVEGMTGGSGPLVVKRALEGSKEGSGRR